MVQWVETYVQIPRTHVGQRVRAFVYNPSALIAKWEEIGAVPKLTGHLASKQSDKGETLPQSGKERTDTQGVLHMYMLTSHRTCKHRHIYILTKNFQSPNK